LMAMVVSAAMAEAQARNSTMDEAMAFKYFSLVR